MASTLKKILLSHTLALALISGGPLYIQRQDLSQNLSGSDLFLLNIKLFGGLFFLGALILGMGGVFRPCVAIIKRLMRGDDLNDCQFRGQLQEFIFFVAEICVALSVLFLIGFLGITF